MLYNNSMKPISAEQVLSLQNAVQHFHDCYLVSSLNALSRSENGRKILQNNIKTDGKAFTVKFNNVNGLSETYLVKKEECDRLVMKNKSATSSEHNPIVNVVEVAMSKLLAIHPDKKPLISRLAKCDEPFEYNKPSNFLYMFTGRKPITVNESGLSMNLKNYKKYIYSIFGKMTETGNSSFVAGTGVQFGTELHNTHCFALNESIEKDGVQIANSPKKKLNFMRLFEGRKQKNITLTREDIIKKVKYISGYFNEMLI